MADLDELIATLLATARPVLIGESWGAMLADANPVLGTAWWYMLFPAAALLLTVLAFNLLGDGLRDALNPRVSRP